MTGRVPWFASLREWQSRRGYPAPWLPFPWRWRLWIMSRRYDLGMKIAAHFCHGNRYGVHTPIWPAVRPLGGQCFCSRVRNRLDYIPF